MRTIERYETVSKPGAVLRVQRVILTPDGYAMLAGFPSEAARIRYVRRRRLMRTALNIVVWVAFGAAVAPSLFAVVTAGGCRVIVVDMP